MINFTRASTATYIDAGGVLRVADNNEPRFEGKGILIEGTSTNLEKFSDGNKFNPSRGTFSMIGGVATYVGSGGRYFLESNTFGGVQILGSTVYTYQFKYRAQGTTSIDVKLDGNRGQLDSGISIKGDTKGVWIHISKTFTSENVEGVLNNGFYLSSPEGGEIKFEIKDIQVEKLSFATSYIPTNGTPVTRVADSLSLPKGTLEMNTSDISIFVEAVGYAKGNSVYNHWLYASSSTPVEFGYMREILYAKYGVDPNLSVKEDVNDLKKGITYDRGSKTLKAYSGSNVSSREYNSLPNDIGSVFIGGSSHKWFGHIKNFRVWNKVLTPNQISLL